jgi:hypothetical protein
MSYLVTDIEPHVTYTFRVCGRSGNKEKWGPWSACKNGVTSLEPHGKFVCNQNRHTIKLKFIVNIPKHISRLIKHEVTNRFST